MVNKYEAPQPAEESDLPQPAPPQPGETDEQIRQRHREALRARNVSQPPGFDSKTASEYLERLRRGDYSIPE